MVASARKGTHRATQSSRSAPPMDTDVIDLLSEDHRKVEELFEDYESTKDEADDEAKAALSQFGLPLRDYDVEVETWASGSNSEVEARVDLTRHDTGATISVKDMRLSPATGEVMTPSHPDHEGTGMLLFP